VLLPARSAARRQATTVKCAAALREIGNCFKMYELDSKGYFPVARLNGWRESVNATPTSYNVDGIDYPRDGVAGSTAGSAQAHWYVFLAKYATKTKVGNAANSDSQTNAAEARKSVFYGCPAFDGYHNGLTVDETNITQTGYGMNPYPTFEAKWPNSTLFPDAFDPPNRWKNYAVHLTQDNSTTPPAPPGNFLKAKQWTHPDRRCLVADSGFWLATSNPVPTGLPTYPTAGFPQIVMNNVNVPGTGQTFLDIYRHGKHPGLTGTGNYDPWSGKFGYNILYADGHVVTQSAGGKEAYLSTRMRYPN